VASLPFFRNHVRTPVTRSRRPRVLTMESLESRALLSAVPFASRPDLIAAHDAGRSATDNKTNVTTPTFEGSARNAESVRIFVGSTDVGTAPVVAGRWSFTHPGFTDGRHAVSAQAIGADGRPGRRSAPLPVEIRTTAPPTPAIALAVPGARPATSGSAATNQARPTFSGAGPINGTVELFVDGASAGRAAVSGRRFTIRPSAPLASGQRTVTAVATDLFGNTSSPATLALAVDAVSPTVESLARTSFDTLTVTFSEAVTGINPGSFRFSGRTSEGFRIASRSLTDRQLQMFVGKITGELSADGRTYTLRAPNLDLAAGSFSITLPAGGRVTDLAGNRLANAGVLSIDVEGA